MGLAGADSVAAIGRRIGRPLPHDFHAARAAEDARVLAEGLDPVAGAIAFVRALPPDLPRAIASSSSSAWIETHLDHLGLRADFGSMVFSGREHVTRGKPAPDVYLHAARRSEEHTSELQSLMRISYAVFCLKKKKRNSNYSHINTLYVQIR